MSIDPDKYQNKYRVASSRLQNWDYGWDASYFITINTKNREHYFGEIIEDKMDYSRVGVIADILWLEIKNHGNNIELGEFIIMPNHVHGIIILDSGQSVETRQTVETRHALSLHESNTINLPEMESIINNHNDSEKTLGEKRFQNQGKNTISAIIGSYKSAVTRNANRLGYESAWQERFHDHIIRDELEFIKITSYIKNNAKNWKDDKFFS